MSFGNKAKLISGQEIPTLGYGTWQSSPGEVEKAIYEAVKAGYRHLDLAKIYQNQVEVAKGFKRALADTGLKREDFFLTSKLWNTCHRPELVEAALDDTLKELELDYLDLYLIHWPVAFEKKSDELFPLAAGKTDETAIDDGVSIVDTWKAMIALPKSKARNVGVSNFTVAHLQAIIDATGVVPAANQIERHPKLQQTDTVIKYCAEKKIHVTAYSAFGNNFFGLPLLIEHPTVKAVAEKRGATPAQVIIAWSQVGGHSVIPKSVTPSRIQSNFEKTKLEDEDVKAINDMGKEPQRFNVPFTYKPKWDIDIFGHELEKNASHKVVLGS